MSAHDPSGECSEIAAVAVAGEGMALPSQEPAMAEARYRVGTLTYTKWGLVVVFIWMLWGDFCFSLMEAVVPNLLPLLLKDHGASNKAIAVIVGTIAMALNTVITPAVSYISDRHRGPRGRRIPFLLWPTPFIVLFLAMLPFAPEICNWALKSGAVASVLSRSPVAPVMLFFGVLVVCFQLFNMVVASIYYYLFNDVVPEQYLGRFFALFRVFGALAGFFFNYFVFGLAGSHMKEIFIGLSLLYGFSFALMCWRVREGEYPPIEDEPRGSLFKNVGNYFRQCFLGPRLYLWFYVSYALSVWAVASTVFQVFFLRDELQIDLDTIGKYRSWAGLVVIILAYPFGIMVDRWRSQRVMMLSTGLLMGANIVSFCCIHGKWSFFVCNMLLSAPAFMMAVANAVWFPDLLPKARYGQFASAASLLTAGTMLAVGPLCGYFFDRVHDYRYVFIWSAVLQAASLLALVKVYQGWKRHGGDNYIAP